LQNAMQVQKNMLDYYGFSYSDDQLQLHHRAGLYPVFKDYPMDRELLVATRAWLRSLMDQNEKNKVFAKDSFARVINYIHTGLFVRNNSNLTLRDYLYSLTTNFKAYSPKHAGKQFLYSLKNGW